MGVAPDGLGPPAPARVDGVNNDVLVAALGRDAVTAVACYRERVVAEAARQGLRLVGGPLVDPIDIQLRIGPNRRRPWLTGAGCCAGPPRPVG